MFEDLILAFYLLITIVQRFFCKCNCIFYGGNILCKEPLSSAKINSSNIVII